jgi:UDP-3-O-[3-hydroxymyristoyl] glucosamine N-acyltransferase
MPFTVADIAHRLHGEVLGNPAAVLTGFSLIDRSQTGDLVFAETAEYFALAQKSDATAVIVAQRFSESAKTLIVVSNARVAFAKALALFFPEPTFPASVHSSVIIAKSAQVDVTAYLGPNCVIGENVKIGARVALQAGNFIGHDSTIGDDSNLFPNVTVYARSQIGQRVRIHAGTVIGSDGYGYVPENGIHLKVPQIGNVIIGDDVEIGANVTVDRGALGSTVIGRGTKIDNLVQVAHNVQIGEHCLLISQTGVAGSTQLGNDVTLAGQVGISGHLKIGNKVTITAQSGVMNNIAEGEMWMGTPAQPDRESKRQIIALRKLPDMLRRINALEKKQGDSPDR